MPDGAKKFVLPLLAALVLLMFAGIWVWIGIELLIFSPSEAAPKLTFDEAQVTVAGFLSSAVAAGTASVLGIEIQKADTSDTGITEALKAATSSSWLLICGITIYALVGIFVLATWVFNSEVAPDLIGAFALGVLGWLSGAFAAVFRADTA